MIHELQTFAVKSGALTEMLAENQSAQEIARPDLGTLEGAWVSEIGSLNRVWNLWSYQDLNQRQEMLEALAKDSRWTEQYLLSLSACVLRRDSRVMTPLTPLKAPEGTGNVYEYRYYRTTLANAPKLAELMTEAIPTRAGYVHDIGMWTTEIGTLDEFSHMVAYPSMAARKEQRSAMVADAEWSRIHKEITHYVEDARVELMLPVAWSALR